MNAAAYRPLIVAWRNGAPVRLEQLGTVIDSVEDDRTASWIYSSDGGMRAINLHGHAPARQQHHRGDRQDQA